MEELMRMIKDVVASQGTSWLVKMAEDLSGTTAAEEGASTSQPVLPSSEEPRGRPTRRRNPPARLSPSPVAKRGGRNSSPRPERLGGNSAVRSQRGREEVEPAERMGVGEPEVAERTTLTRGDIRQGERGSRPGNRMSACGATMSRSPRSRRVPQESGTARYAREYQQTSLPAPNVPLAMPEVNEADVTFQGAAPDGGGRGVSDWTVWVVGHSYVYWAEKRARNRPIGVNLGLNVPVRWLGIRGLQWPRLLQEVLKISSWKNDRVILVIHAGGNDLGKIKVAELIALMKADIFRFKEFFKRVIIVWSDIVARRIWREARDNEAIERVRKTVNFRISKHVRALGGIAIRHWELERRERGMMRGDGVHLSDIGLDTFLSRLQDGVESALLLACGGRSAA
ncbi:uncharacterized protein [Eleutherodactylus coqui]|uniref:uncharacterized protein isoform X3 n=1 Tax=Eleutherodactylus coqui TaxID=57060 RepID=UPI0034617D0B